MNLVHIHRILSVFLICNDNTAQSLSGVYLVNINIFTIKSYFLPQFPQIFLKVVALRGVLIIDGALLESVLLCYMGIIFSLFILMINSIP